MKLRRNRLVLTVGLSAAFGFLPTVAMAADGDGLDRLAQARAVDQQPAASVKAPAAQGVSDAVRVKWVPTFEHLNDPGNPAFGRVASK